MSVSRRVGVVGASGAVGAEIIQVLDGASWRPDELVALARTSTSKSHVDYGTERVPIDDVADEAMDGLDTLFLAIPPADAADVAERALDEGVPVIDLSGTLRGHPDVVVAVPWINPEALLGDPPLGVVVPGPEATLLGSVLGPLHRAGVVGPVRASIMLPASAWGRGGIEELAGQVRALFNGETPPRRLFEQGLAFDVMPDTGGREARAIDELAQILSMSPSHIDLETIGIPVFSGVSASMTIRPSRTVEPGLVAKVLQDGGVIVADDDGERSIPRPRRVEGKPFAHVGRVRVDPDGALRLWCAMDNLRTAATAAVASAGAVLTRQG